MLVANLAVDLRVEIGIVIHLHLPIEFEGLCADEDGVDQGDGGVDEIGTLLLQNGEAIEILYAMGRSGGGAIGLFAGVKELESEDGKAIEHHTGGFGVELRGGELREMLKEPQVDLFDEVVALLVKAVDGALDGGDLGVGGEGIAGFVFFMPKVEVGAVLAGDQVL